MLKETLDLLNEIGEIPASGRFTLVGGTALAFHTNHRLSEDLDFATFDDQLDQVAIKQILARLTQSHRITDATTVGDMEEALNDGYDLLTRQQNWMVDKVRLSFFVMGDTAREKEAIQSGTPIPYKHTRILSLDGLFASKCLVLLNRIRSRDLFDLHWFVTKGNYSIQEIFITIQKVYPEWSYERIRNRLLDWPIPLTDEGFVSVINGNPMVEKAITIESIRDSLRHLVDEMEVEIAKEILSRPS